MQTITKDLVDEKSSYTMIRLRNAIWVPGIFKVNVPGVQDALTFEKNVAVKIPTSVANVLLGLKHKAGTTQYGGKIYDTLFEIVTVQEYTPTNPKQIAAEVDVLKTQLANLMKLLPKEAVEQMYDAGVNQLDTDVDEGEYVEDVAEIERVGVVVDGSTAMTQDGSLICPICSTWKTKPDLEPDRAKRSLDAHIRKAHANTTSESE